MSLLTIEGLEIEIGSRKPVSGLSLELQAGQILGLVGASGSGKSLTALAIARLLPAGAKAAGSIRLDGIELSTKTEPEMCHLRGAEIGLVFQEPMTALDPVMKVDAQVAEAVRQHRRISRAATRRDVGQALESAGLPDSEGLRDRYPHELSGGQRQRVSIAIAIAAGARLLIADEPTTALDVTSQAGILRLLRHLAEVEGKGILLIGHDLAAIATVADRVAVMAHGRIVETAPPAELFRAPRAAATRALVEASNALPRRSRQPRPGAAPFLAATGISHDHAMRASAPWRPRRRIAALKDIDLTIAAGESVGLVGRSGCGKSTLLRVLLGLERPRSGEVKLSGEAFSKAPSRVQRRLRRHLQIVFQDPFGSFDPRWRVEDLVAEPLGLLDPVLGPRERRARVEAGLEQVGLTAGDARRWPHEFSGGQRQRIAIARALIVNPALVALDEVTSALDMATRAQILSLLADLADRRGLAYLMVSHDLALVRGMTDRVLVMQAGRIVETGSTEAVFAAPRHPYTQELIAAIPVLPVWEAAQP